MLMIAATQLDGRYTRTQATRIGSEWAAFFEGGQSPIHELKFVSRKPRRLFASLAGQTQLRRSLKLLLTSGLRVEEASELTTIDVLKRVLPDGRAYYLLHIKPSKYDRPRVIPMGDGLGRVIAEIIRHVKASYASTAVPACDRRDSSQKTPLPRAPYLLQGAGHSSAMSIATIRERSQHLSVAAGARHADGTPLRLAPYDCRRMFATEALNANTPGTSLQHSWVTSPSTP